MDVPSSGYAYQVEVNFEPDCIARIISPKSGAIRHCCIMSVYSVVALFGGWVRESAKEACRYRGQTDGARDVRDYDSALAGGRRSAPQRSTGTSYA